jgi:hypothetical protein
LETWGRQTERERERDEKCGGISRDSILSGKKERKLLLL